MKKRNIAFFFLLHGRILDFTTCKYIITWEVKTIWAKSRKEAYYNYFSSVYTGHSRLTISSDTPDYFKYLCAADTEQVDRTYYESKLKALEKAEFILDKHFDYKGKARIHEQKIRYLKSYCKRKV